MLSCGIVSRFPTSGQLCAVSLFFNISSRNSIDSSPFYANGLTFSSQTLSDISRYHTLFKKHFWRFKKNYIAELWDRMSFSDFRSAVRSFIVLRHFFTEFDRFLLVLSKQLCLVVKTTVLCCFPGCGGSPLTSITTAYYAVMRA